MCVGLYLPPFSTSHTRSAFSSSAAWPSAQQWTGINPTPSRRFAKGRRKRQWKRHRCSMLLSPPRRTSSTILMATMGMARARRAQEGSPHTMFITITIINSSRSCSQQQQHGRQKQQLRQLSSFPPFATRASTSAHRAHD